MPRTEVLSRGSGASLSFALSSRANRGICFARARRRMALIGTYPLPPRFFRIMGLYTFPRQVLEPQWFISKFFVSFTWRPSISGNPADSMVDSSYVTSDRFGLCSYAKSPAPGPFGPDRRARFIYDDLLDYLLA